MLTDRKSCLSSSKNKIFEVFSLIFIILRPEQLPTTHTDAKKEITDTKAHGSPATVAVPSIEEGEGGTMTTAPSGTPTTAGPSRKRNAYFGSNPEPHVNFEIP